MRTQSSPFMPIVIKIDEPFINNEFQDSSDEPFDLDRECDAYVRDLAQFTLQRLKQHLDAEEAHNEVFLPRKVDKAA